MLLMWHVFLIIHGFFNAAKKDRNPKHDEEMLDYIISKRSFCFLETYATNWGCDGTHESRFSTYLGVGVTVQYGLSKMGKKQQKFTHITFFSFI